MNKYKMISICSLTIACILMLSILLPIRTIANDKESIEIKMHYADSQVTTDITVNSDVYSSIVCKYLMIEDILKCDDILSQTRDSGKTISLDKSEDGKYQVTIPNVDKRYVVVYVSIGNCSLCDYIDCKPNASEEKKEEPKKEEQEHNMSVEGEGENGQKAEAKTNNEENKPAEGNKPEENSKPAEEVKPEENNKPAEEVKQEENKPAEENKPEENKQEENKAENNEKPAEQSEPVKEQLVVDSAKQIATEFQSIEDITPKAQVEENKSNNTNNNTKTTEPKTENKNNVNTSTTNTTPVSNGDKDAVDTTDFEEIEKIISSSTADGNMPQTGEDDFAKILGIIVFSVVSALSFYKYKTTK